MRESQRFGRPFLANYPVAKSAAIQNWTQCSSQGNLSGLLRLGIVAVLAVEGAEQSGKLPFPPQKCPRCTLVTGLTSSCKGLLPHSHSVLQSSGVHNSTSTTVAFTLHTNNNYNDVRWFLFATSINAIAVWDGLRQETTTGHC